MATFNVTVIDTENSHDSLAVVVGQPVFETIKTSIDLSPNVTYLLAETISTHPALSSAYKAGAKVIETAYLKTSSILFSILKPKLIDQINVHAAIIRSFVALLAQNVQIQDIETIGLQIKLLQDLILGENETLVSKYGPSLIEGFLLNGLPAWFLGGTLAENLRMTSTFIPQWQWVRMLEDGVVTADTPSRSLLVRLFTDDSFEVSEADIVQMIFDGQLADTIDLAMAYFSPSGNLTTWAINTRTNSVTQYDNFYFRSYTKWGHHFYGANSDGLWRLDGALDGSESIQTIFGSGLFQPGGSHFTSFTEAYLGLRTNDDGKDYFLKMVTGDGREYLYQFQPNTSMMTSKVKFGKGLRSRYWRWELQTRGADFDLDTVEFVPIAAKRRV